MKLRPWKNLEKKMKCGPSICGTGGIQIWQRRSRVPLGTQKNVYGFLHTRSSGRANARPFFNVAGRAALGRLTASRIRRPRPRLIRRE